MGKKKTTKEKAALAVREIAVDRKINKYKLDDAAIDQADFFGFYADQKPDLKTDIDNLKVDLKALTGEKFGHYKETLDGGVDSKGNAKDPTDGAVNKAVDCDKDIIALQKEIISAENSLGKIEAALTTLDQRRSMIKVTQQLFSDEYWDNKTAYETENMAVESSKTKRNKSKAIMEDKLSEMGDDDYEEQEVDEEIEEEIIEETESEEETIDEEIIEESTEEEEEDSGEEDGDDLEEATENVEEDDAEEVDSSEEEGCPHKHNYGADFGEFADCDECDKETECWKKSKE